MMYQVLVKVQNWIKTLSNI